MARDSDFLKRHAESRRAFLAKTAVTSPAVSLLLAQAARPARAQTYGGGPETTTTEFQTTQSSSTITFPVSTTIRITSPTTVTFTVPGTTTVRITSPTTVTFTLPGTTTVRLP